MNQHFGAFVCAYTCQRPVEKVIALNITLTNNKGKISLTLNEAEALKIVKTLAKQLDVKDVLAAVTDAVKAK